MERHGKFYLIKRYSEGLRKYYMLILVGSLISTILNACIPRMISFSIDHVLVEGGIKFLKERIWILALAVIFLALGNGLAIYLYKIYTAKVGEILTKRMRDSLFSHIQKLPLKWHKRNATGDILQRCTADVETIRTFVMTQLLEVFQTCFLLIVSLFMMISMNGRLTLVAIAFVPIVVLYSWIFFGMIARNFEAADEAEGELSTVVQENATGVRVVRAFGREQFEIERFDQKNERFANLWIRLGTISGLYWGVGDLITGFQVMTVIIFGSIAAVRGNLTVGEFIAFASYNTTLVWPIRRLGRVISEMSKAGVSFERVNYILNAEEESTKGNEIPENLDIDFSNVSFSYEKNIKILDDLTFTIKEGETVGILGGTGSGKSTMVQLLEKLYELEEGSIKIGGCDIRNIETGWVRSKIGIVLQEPFLYSKTIKENIAAGNPDATMEEIRRAADIACVDKTIMDFPDGYETMVGERGVTLSGGQRQRIAIARMILSGKKIMIFDDSLSAVDAQTDYEIRKKLRTYMKDATVILISHRITTLMEAEKILVMNHGKLEEMGSHESLIKNNGIYQKIYEIQMNSGDRRLVEEE